MGTIGQRDGGFDYIQNNQPLDVHIGKSWYSSEKESGFVGIGDIYIDSYTRDHAGFSAGGTTLSANDFTSDPTIFSFKLTKLRFIDEVVFEVQENLSNGRWTAAGMESKTHGYICGGLKEDRSGNEDSIERLTFTNESIKTLSNNLNVSRQSAFGFSSIQSGFIAGGFGEPISYTSLNSIEKVDFTSFEIPEVISSTISQARGRGGAFESQSEGFILGGCNIIDVFGNEPNAFSTPSSETYDKIEKIKFVVDIIQDVEESLLFKLYKFGACSSLSHGYIAGGVQYSTSLSSNITVDKFRFSNETRGQTQNNLSFEREDSPASYSSGNNGYFLGATSSAGDTLSISRLSFSTETTSTISSTIPYYTGSSSSEFNYSCGMNYGGKF